MQYIPGSLQQPPKYFEQQRRDRNSQALGIAIT